MPDPCNCEQALELENALDRLVEISERCLEYTATKSMIRRDLQHAVNRAREILKRWSPGKTVFILRYLPMGETMSITVVVIDGAVTKATDTDGNDVRLSDYEEKVALHEAGM